MLVVKDSFFKKELSDLIEKGAALYPWSYHHKSDMADPMHNKFFVSLLWNQSSAENFFSILWTMIRTDVPALQNYDCWRIIANGQVKGQNGNWHKDHGDVTVLYFPLQWMPEWGGSTFLKIDNSEKEVKYSKNRLVIFNADIFHYGACPNIENILRISIAFNLRESNP